MICILTSCSVFKNNRYPTYEQGILDFFKTNYQLQEHDKYNENLEISILDRDTIIIFDSFEIIFSSDNPNYIELFNNKLIPHIFY